MKKIIIVTIALAIALSLVGCEKIKQMFGGGSNPSTAPQPSTQQTTSQQPQAVPSQPSTQQPGSVNFSGTYQTDFGKMTLIQNGNQVTGSYEYNSGRISGAIDNGILYFTWMESGGTSSGTGYFQLSADGKKFTGKWRYGTSGAYTDNWNGTKI
jgi:hypothetical protein